MSRPGDSADVQAASGGGRNEQILGILREAGRPMRTGEIAAKVGVERKVITTTMARLCALGLVQRSRAGGPKARDGEKERLWRIKPAA